MGVLTHTKQACTDFKWEMNRKNRYSPLNVNFRGKKRVQLCSVSHRDREHPLAQTLASPAGM